MTQKEMLSRMSIIVPIKKVDEDQSLLSSKKDKKCTIKASLNDLNIILPL